MATPINTPLTGGEIWHLSIEDLLQPLHETPRLGGPGPFVINLSASSAPIGQPAKQLTDLSSTAHVYQITRTEDHRPRYRLRLGPFATEDEADALLRKVRDLYPSALTATAESDDLRAIASLQAKAEAMATGRHAQRAAGTRTTPSAQPAPKPRAAPATQTSSQAPPTAHITPPPARVTLEVQAPAPVPQVPKAPAQPASSPVAVAPLAPASKTPVAPSASPRAAAPRRPAMQPLAIPVLSDTVSMVRHPPIQARARAATAKGDKPAPTIKHKVMPTITHKVVPTITDEVALEPKAAPAAAAAAPAARPMSQPLKVVPAAPAPLKAVETAPPAVPARAAAPAATKPAAPVPAKPAEAPSTVKPVPVATAAIKPAPVATAAIKPVPVATASIKPASVTPAPIKPMAAAPAAIKSARAPAPAPRVAALSRPLPSLESTQTLRPLTQLELDDDAISQWFVIQLSLGEEAPDPESLPNLDIFSEYRLYSVAGIDQGKLMHALRLGFFAEEGAAAAVASYLSSFYEKPAVKRISTAERDRFSDQLVEARMDVGATGRHAVIEITNERVVREKRTSGTVTPMPFRAAPALQAAARKAK